MEDVMYFGWYSQKMAKSFGSVYYYTPYGGRVEVTAVTESEDHGMQWTDVMCVGAVTEYSHQGSKGFYSYKEGDEARKLVAYNADVELFGATH